MVISRETDNFKRASRDVSEYLYTKEWCLRCRYAYYPDQSLHFCTGVEIPHCVCVQVMCMLAQVPRKPGVESFVVEITG